MATTQQWWMTPVAGGLSGVFGDVCTHPIATVKTRLQVQGAGAEARSYNGALQASKHMLKTEGPLSFFQGVGAVVGGAPFASALYFSGIGLTRKVFGQSDTANFSGGVIGQLTGSLAWVPMDVVKERLQVEGQVSMKKSYGGSISCLRGIIASEGIGGLYRAYWIHQGTWAPFNGLYWLFYGRSLKVLESYGFHGTVGFVGASTIAGITASFVTSPLDLVKTRMQVQMANPSLFAFHGSWGCAKTVFRNEGFGAFFTGVGARCAWLTPRYVIVTSCFELLLRCFSRSPEQKIKKSIEL